MNPEPYPPYNRPMTMDSPHDMSDEPSPPLRPRHLDLDRERALTVHWSDGRVSIYPVRYLRKMSPSAEARELREQMQRNPLTVLPSTSGQEGDHGQLTAEKLDLVGNYALRITFSDGHDTGIYSWGYLRQIDPNQPDESDQTEQAT